MDPCTRIPHHRLGTQSQSSCAADDLDNRGHGGGMLGQFLAWAKTEKHDLN